MTESSISGSYIGFLLRAMRTGAGRAALGHGAACLLIGLGLAGPVLSEPLPIILDGDFSDWEGVAPLHDDPSGDGGYTDIDFDRLWAADDADFLFLAFETGTELNLQQDNALVLYLDTDADSQTGFAVGGIGAELAWRFGERQGTFYHDGSSTAVFHDEIRFRALTSYTSGIFELAVGRHVRPDGTHPLFTGPEVRILLKDAAGGDQLPDSGEILAYVMDDGPAPPDSALAMQRLSEADLRIISYNVLNDGPWTGGQADEFGRQLAAVSPDILNFQEIYEHTAQQTAAFVEDWLPAGPGETWHAAENADCKTVSRYPILGQWPIDGNLAVLLDAAPVLGSDLLIVNAHLPCCSYDDERQAEVDRILAFLRDAREPGGEVDLDPETPILVLGDLNLVGLAQQLRSLLTGDIADEGTYGSDFAPDWDGTDLAQSYWRQTELRMGYTWRNDNSTYWPGHLDYVIYTDAVLELRNHYALYTPEMSADSLQAHGLQGADSEASDHLLCCADFRPADSADVSQSEPYRGALRLRIFPNPSVGPAHLAFRPSGPGAYRIDIYDPRGRRVGPRSGWTPIPESSSHAPWEARLGEDARLASGVYHIRLLARDAQGTRVAWGTWTLLR